MKNFLKKIIYSSNITLFVFIKIKRLFVKPISQSNEAQIIDKLINKYKIDKNYLEIGFSPWEYNCSKISNDNQGVIIDADKVNIKIGRWLIKKARLICEFIDLDNIEKILKKIDLNIDILSLDIDGNDYYIMERLIKLNPSLIICEYNAAYYLRPITSIYKKNFDRTKEHETRFYFGCSLKGWEILMKKNGYSMVSISNSGVNVFFIKDNLITDKSEVITPEKNFVDIYWPKEIRNICMSKSISPQINAQYRFTHTDVWKRVKDMKYKIIS